MSARPHYRKVQRATHFPVCTFAAIAVGDAFEQLQKLFKRLVFNRNGSIEEEDDNEAEEEEEIEAKKKKKKKTKKEGNLSNQGKEHILDGTTSWKRCRCSHKTCVKLEWFKRRRRRRRRKTVCLIRATSIYHAM
jgi:hypothetical protein